MPDLVPSEKPSLLRYGVIFCMILLVTAIVYAQTQESHHVSVASESVGTIDSGDTAWVLMSTGLVMLMTPGLAFFYGGLVRRKNVLSILMQCMMIMCLVSVEWVLIGYSMAFSPGNWFIGSLQWVGLAGIGGEPSIYAKTIPHTIFVMFQAMFAVITPCLIIGAFAERMRFGPFCLFTLLWSLVVYNPVAHWVWGDGGFLKEAGALDFAGGTVVHINAGVASLAAALFLGKRKGYPHQISPPHNLPFAVLGAGLLWFGWFGFNAGSALSAGALAASALLNTHTAAAVAGLTWALLDWLKHGRPTMLGMITGAVAGLATVTQAAGYITPMGAVWFGILGGGVCWFSVTFMKVRFGYDDSLDAFGVHGVGGILGAFATGLFATMLINADGANGLFVNGSASLLFAQTKAVVVVGVYSFVASLCLFKLVDIVVPLRVNEMDERIGLDLTLHREAGYTVID